MKNIYITFQIFKDLIEMKLYKSSLVQWLGYLALTEETGVQFPYEENFFNY